MPSQLFLCLCYTSLSIIIECVYMRDSEGPFPFCLFQECAKQFERFSDAAILQCRQALTFHNVGIYINHEFNCLCL